MKQNEAKEKFAQMINHINDGVASTMVLFGPQACYSILKQVAIWNLGFKNRQRDYEIHTTIKLKTCYFLDTNKIDNQTEKTGFQIYFWRLDLCKDKDISTYHIIGQIDYPSYLE